MRRYLQRWGLMTPELAAHLIRFITDPASRSYVICYPAAIRCQRPLRGRGIPRANVDRPQATRADAEPLFRQLKCSVSLSGHGWRRPGGDWGSRGRRFKSGRPDW